MANNYGLSHLEIDQVHAINPEVAAHNIAMVYINSSASTEKLFGGEDVVMSDVLSLSHQYAEAYNYAYNLIAHQNRIIDEAE